VTHHVEEIVPAFSHVLVLKSGTVLASGEKGTALNSRTLSSAFNARMRLRMNGKRYEPGIR
jgi:iron complex transport system ATP-binding protein